MEEYEVPCPGCQSMLFIVVGERGFFSTSGDYALSADDLATTPLRPGDPAGLDGIARRLHEVAVADGQREVAEALTFVFGHATCPAAKGTSRWPARSAPNGQPRIRAGICHVVFAASSGGL
ncbi:hypothetical protein ACFWBC_15485 [Streptomyces sp. NPDC059985]|uniref:hypothetical protein n=1 Tax=Streptomyces sp. NPDC059985 TaxID=3347025 RepID=UPI0036892A2A